MPSNINHFGIFGFSYSPSVFPSLKTSVIQWLQFSDKFLHHLAQLVSCFSLSSTSAPVKKQNFVWVFQIKLSTFYDAYMHNTFINTPNNAPQYTYYSNPSIAHKYIFSSMTFLKYVTMVFKIISRYMMKLKKDFKHIYILINSSVNL